MGDANILYASLLAPQYDGIIILQNTRT